MEMEEIIEKNIKEEYGDVLNITDEEIEKMSFLEACNYVEKLNEIIDKIEKSNSKEDL